MRPEDEAEALAAGVSTILRKPEVVETLEQSLGDLPGKVREASHATAGP